MHDRFLLLRVLLGLSTLLLPSKQNGVVALVPLFRNPSRAMLPPSWPMTVTTTRQILSPGRGRRSKKGNLELGIQTVQWLTNKKKQEQFRRDLIQQYPLVPHFLIDGAINTVAAGFVNMAPETLQEALQPGGMARFRPVLREAVVDFAMEQKAVRDVPLVDTKDKKLWVGSLVDMALDQLFADAEWVLSSPEVRLEALEQEIRTIKEMEMTRRRIVMYNVRRHPWRYIGAAGVAALVTAYCLNIFPWLNIVATALHKVSMMVGAAVSGAVGALSKCGGWCLSTVTNTATSVWSIASPFVGSTVKIVASGLALGTGWVASFGRYAFSLLQWSISALLKLLKAHNIF